MVCMCQTDTAAWTSLDTACTNRTLIAAPLLYIMLVHKVDPVVIAPVAEAEVAATVWMWRILRAPVLTNTKKTAHNAYSAHARTTTADIADKKSEERKTQEHRRRQEERGEAASKSRRTGPDHDEYVRQGAGNLNDSSTSGGSRGCWRGSTDQMGELMTTEEECKLRPRHPGSQQSSGVGSREISGDKSRGLDVASSRRADTHDQRDGRDSMGNRVPRTGGLQNSDGSNELAQLRQKALETIDIERRGKWGE
eukprot:1189109-Prorocentrum_minimum.AAC.1